jgi:uncharacterized membrane protein
MKPWFFLAPFALAATAFFHPIPAMAGLHFCNKTSVKIYVAIATINGDCEYDACTFSSHGWWTIDPDSCKMPIGASLDTTGDTEYYYYAQDANGQTWTGTTSFCVDPDNAFDFNDAQASAGGCTSRKFQKLETATYSNYTFNLTP